MGPEIQARGAEVETRGSSNVNLGAANLTTTGTITTGNLTSPGSIELTGAASQFIASGNQGTAAAPVFDIKSGTANAGVYAGSSSVTVCLGANGTQRAQADSTGLMSVNGPVRVASGAYLQFIGQAAPSAPTGVGAIFYNADNGGGKSQIRALFDTGAAQAIATEP